MLSNAIFNTFTLKEAFVIYRKGDQLSRPLHCLKCLSIHGFSISNVIATRGILNLPVV